MQGFRSPKKSCGCGGSDGYQNRPIYRTTTEGINQDGYRSIGSIGNPSVGGYGSYGSGTRSNQQPLSAGGYAGARSQSNGIVGRYADDYTNANFGYAGLADGARSPRPVSPTRGVPRRPMSPGRDGASRNARPVSPQRPPRTAPRPVSPQRYRRGKPQQSPQRTAIPANADGYADGYGIDLTRLTPSGKRRGDMTYSIEEMKDIAAGLGLQATGSKSDLYNRIVERINPQRTAIPANADGYGIDLTRLTPSGKRRGDTTYSIEEMKDIAAGLGLQATGSKSDLYNRIVQRINPQPGPIEKADGYGTRFTTGPDRMRNIQYYTTPELKDLAKVLGLRFTGSKQELYDRIMASPGDGYRSQGNKSPRKR